VVEIRLISTSGGAVEIAESPGQRAPVLFFPGGHCSADCDCGWSLYIQAGHGIISFSRPGYGGTRVGPRSPAEFAPLVREVCEVLGQERIAASVGVSFGGMQAVHVAQLPNLDVPRLVLHSCAPSRISYPDSAAEAIGGRILFSPPFERLVWQVLHRAVRSDAGLRRVIARLSTLPADDWWDELTVAERHQARQLFCAMSSGSGFGNDLRQGRRRLSAARGAVLSKVACPTLVTGSRHDRGVSFRHAEDLADAIPGATLVELESPSHLFWIGSERDRGASIVTAFLD
jgi:pimeloyl-ACP methyl ester carboxylesterase